MVAITFIGPDPTLVAVDKLIEAKAVNEKPRDYLGMSSIGDCARKQWLRYHGKREPFDALALKRFEDGHRTELLITDRLSMIDSIELSTLDEDGHQWAHSDFDGRFKGHMDGVIRGIFQAPKTWHVFEAKCSSKWKDLDKAKLKVGEKQALQVWSPTYYAQAILYMDYAELERHYTVVASPGGREWTSVRTNANPEYAAALKAKAKRILEAKEPPQCTCIQAFSGFCNGA